MRHSPRQGSGGEAAGVWGASNQRLVPAQWPQPGWPRPHASHTRQGTKQGVTLPSISVEVSGLRVRSGGRYNLKSWLAQD